jgi:hypothetical protein
MSEKSHFIAKKQHERWTPSQDAKLKKLIKEGKNSAEIAAELGRTRSAIMGRKYNLGIKDAMKPAVGSDMPYTAYDKKRSKNTGNRNANPGIDLKGALDEEIKSQSKTVDVKAEVKAIVKETKSVLKETGKKFKSIGNSIDVLFRKAKKQGLKVTITIDSEIE